MSAPGIGNTSLLPRTPPSPAAVASFLFDKSAIRFPAVSFCFPDLGFNSIEELDRMTTQGIVALGACTLGSTTGTEVAQVLKNICMAFFNWTALVNGRSGKKPRPRPEACVDGLLAVFGYTEYTKAIANGECGVPGKHYEERPCRSLNHSDVPAKGKGHKQFAMRRLCQWCEDSLHPHARILLGIVRDPRFEDVLMKLHAAWHQEARAVRKRTRSEEAATLEALKALKNPVRFTDALFSV